MQKSTIRAVVLSKSRKVGAANGFNNEPFGHCFERHDEGGWSQSGQNKCKSVKTKPRKSIFILLTLQVTSLVNLVLVTNVDDFWQCKGFAIVQITEITLQSAPEYKIMD